LTLADARTYAGVVASALYERLGQTYQQARRPDPRIDRLLVAAIGDAHSVISVGAGTGSYEPADRYVVAVAPAAAMRARRPATAAPCIAASAEALPFDDASIDVAMAIYSDFHWADRARGIAEMMRVARRSVVLLTVDSATTDSSG
jgi:SAM-dependent methyltransferase